MRPVNHHIGTAIIYKVGGNSSTVVLYSCYFVIVSRRRYNLKFDYLVAVLCILKGVEVWKFSVRRTYFPSFFLHSIFVNLDRHYKIKMPYKGQIKSQKHE